MVLIAALIVTLASATPAAGAKATVMRAHLEVLGPAGCITRADIVSRVAARSSRIRLDAGDASVVATVAVTLQQPSRVTAELTMLGQSTAPTSRRVVARSCQEAADAVALMMAVTLEQIRRARHLTLADDLRLERGLMRHSLHLRPGASEAIEGIRALAIDKDRSPRWSPARVEDVDPALVAAFFESPWPAHAHPLRTLED